MIVATQFWCVDLPWWAFWPLAVLVVIVAGVILFALYEWWDDREIRN
jgi:hypothetical protein